MIIKYSAWTAFLYQIYILPQGKTSQAKYIKILNKLFHLLKNILCHVFNYFFLKEMFPLIERARRASQTTGDFFQFEK